MAIESTVLNDSENSDVDIDLFGLSEDQNQRKAEIMEMFTDETYDIMLNMENYQLRNNKNGRVVADRLAEMVFNMLLRNGFEQITLDHSSLETPAPCASGEFAPHIFFSWEEFFENSSDAPWQGLYEKSEEGDPEAVALYEAAINGGIFGLLENSEFWDFAKSWAQVEADKAQAVSACGACPLKAQCLAASITLPTSSGGFTDPSCVDRYGISGGYDFQSREYVHSKVVKLIRAYKRQLREDQIIVVEGNSEGLTDEQWSVAINDGEEFSTEEVVAEETVANEFEISDDDLVALRDTVEEDDGDDFDIDSALAELDQELRSA